jgi:hypothetical protein
VTPLGAGGLWPAIGHFAITNGAISAVTVGPEWSPLTTTVFGIGNAVSTTVTLSMIRDFTVVLAGTLNQIDPTNPTQPLNMKRGGMIPTDWISSGPPAAWESKTLSGCYFVADPPVDGALKVRVEQHSPFGPASEALVLEVDGVVCPQTVAVVWPHAVSRAANAGPTPFLVYFHHPIGQELVGGFYPPGDPELGDYPFGFDYAYFGLWRYINYAANPITGDEEINNFKGLAYQIGVAGKPVVLVVPCNKMLHQPEIGEAANPLWLQALLREIQSLMFRRAGTFSPPPAVGRVALASFSGAGVFVRDILQQLTPPAGTLPDFVREVFLFDPGLDINVSCVDAVADWLVAGNSADKRARLYTQWPPANASRLHSPGGSLGNAAAVRGRSSVGVFTTGAWSTALAAAGGAPIAAGREWQSLHPLISASMLTDAMRASGF